MIFFAVIVLITRFLFIIICIVAMVGIARGVYNTDIATLMMMMW